MQRERAAGRSTIAPARVVEALNGLLQLDHDAIGVYQMASEQLRDRALAARLSVLVRAHQRHIRRLVETIEALGGAPRHEPHVTVLAREAAQRLAALAGDGGVLAALRVHARWFHARYHRSAKRAARWPEAARRVVRENARDQDRHRRWLRAAARRGAARRAVRAP